jgi:hypothetical protein
VELNLEVPLEIYERVVVVLWGECGTHGRETYFTGEKPILLKYHSPRILVQTRSLVLTILIGAIFRIFPFI